MRRMIREVEPPRPSDRISTLAAATLSTVSERRNSDPRKLSHSVRGELDWIVLKALEKDRTRRYETASALANDVQHYIDGDAVAACPPSVRYRLSKFTRRNKVAIATCSLVAMACLVGTGVSLWQMNSAIASRGEALLAREAATQHFAFAREAVDNLMTRVSEEELLNVPRMEKTRQALLTDALKYYEKMAGLKAEDPSLRLEIASAHGRIGKIQADLNNRDAALLAHETATRQLRQLNSEFPNQFKYQMALGKSLSAQAAALSSQAFTRGSEAQRHESLLYCDEAIRLLEPLVDEFNAELEPKLTLLETYRH
jgi:hypothetical protein